MNARKIFKFVSLIVILAVGTWLLWPPSDEGETAGAAAAEAPGGPRAGVKYTIRFSPGNSYLPGMTPDGIGSPLKGLADVVADYEKLHPDTHIELVTAPVGVREYLVTQLISGMAPEIINVNVEDVWQDIQKNWYVKFNKLLDSPNPYVKPGEPGSVRWWDQIKYPGISRGTAAPDRNYYCICYDMVETGIYYNKNIFRKVGVEEPKDFEDFMRICQKIKDYTNEKGEHPYTPILLGQWTMADWCLDLFFDQFYAQITPGIDLSAGQDPERELYLKHYLDWDEISFLRKKGFFGKKDPRWREVFKVMYRFRQMANRNLTTIDPIREFVTQSGAMYWAASPFTYHLMVDKKLGFDWGIFYMPAFTQATSKYADGHPMCVIGGPGTQYEITNSAISDTGNPETSERLKRVGDFLYFLMAPQNYIKVVNETPRYLTNIIGVPVQPPLQPFDDFLKRDYSSSKWMFTFDLKFSETLLRMLDLYLNDGITLDEFIWWIETSLEQACQNIELRKPPDWAELQRSWDSKAPARAKMKDLPDEAYR